MIVCYCYLQRFPRSTIYLTNHYLKGIVLYKVNNSFNLIYIFANSNLDAIKTKLDSLSQEVWDLLESKDHSINNNQDVQDTLSKLGLTSKDDITLLSPESAQQIANLLKLVPRKKFLANMSKIKAMVGQK